MTNKQDTSSKAEAVAGESLKDGAQHKISSTSEKGALGDNSLDDVSGGLWPYVMSGSAYNKTI